MLSGQSYRAYLMVSLYILGNVESLLYQKRALPDIQPTTEQIAEIRQELDAHAAAHPDGDFPAPAINDRGYEVNTDKYWRKAFEEGDNDISFSHRERAQKKYEMLLRDSALELGIHAWKHKMRTRKVEQQMQKGLRKGNKADQKANAYRALSLGLAQGRKVSDEEAAHRYLNIIGLTQEEEDRLNRKSLLGKLRPSKKVPKARLQQSKAAILANHAHAYFDLVKSREKLAIYTQKHQDGQTSDEKLHRTRLKSRHKEQAIAHRNEHAAALLYQYYTSARQLHHANAAAIQQQLPLMRAKTAVWTDLARRASRNVPPPLDYEISSSQHFSDEDD